MNRRTLTGAVIVVCLGLLGRASAQDHAHHAAPKVIDGAQNPAAIPDDVAWRLFLRSLSEPEPAGASPEQAKRLRAKLGHIGLDEPETAIFHGVIGAFHAELERIEKRLQALGPTTPGSPKRAEAQALDAALDRLFASTRAHLESSGLAPQTLAKLRNHVQAAKRDMKMVPLPPAPSRSN